VSGHDIEVCKTSRGQSFVGAWKEPELGWIGLAAEAHATQVGITGREARSADRIVVDSEQHFAGAAQLDGISIRANGRREALGRTNREFHDASRNSSALCQEIDELTFLAASNVPTMKIRVGELGPQFAQAPGARRIVNTGIVCHENVDRAS